MTTPDLNSLEKLLESAKHNLEESPDIACEAARSVLEAAPEHLGALRVRAFADHRLGRHRRAVSTLEQLLRNGSDDGELWHELGEAHHRAGEQEKAGMAARRAVTLAPNSPRSWLLLGSTLTARGDEDGANAAYLEYLRLGESEGELHEAAQMLAQKEFAAAAKRIERRLRRWPGDIVAMRMLAEARVSDRKYEDALRLLERILARVPGFHAARQNLVVVLNRLGRHAEALSELDVLLMEVANDPALKDMRAVLLSRVGDVDRSIMAFEDLVRRTPQAAHVWHGYGHALKAAGRSTEAVDAYRRAIAIQPGQGSVWWSLANLKTVRFSQDDVAAMRAYLTRSDTDPESRMHFEFALAKALEDQRIYAEAFVHYSQGNQIRREHLSYDASETTTRHREARSIYNREFFAARRSAGCRAPDPIFVLGMPRAGSTLVEQILSSHPLVEGTAELPAVIATTQELRRRVPPGQLESYHPVVATLSAAELSELGERYIERTRTQRRSDAPFFIDKMPNNFAHIGLIKLMLPNAKIIDVRRHPMACCFSNFKQNFARGQTFSYDLGDLGSYYRDYVALMAHFDGVLPGEIHRVIYEQLVDDTESVVRRMLDYCGLEFDPRCLRYFENERVVRTASSEQVRRPIFREGLDHWKHFDAWLGPLKSALGSVLGSYPDVPPDI